MPDECFSDNILIIEVFSVVKTKHFSVDNHKSGQFHNKRVNLIQIFRFD